MPGKRSAATERERALDALARARREYLDLSVAAYEVGLHPDVVLYHVGAGFEQRRGRWFPRPFDAIPRDMTFLTDHGAKPVRVRDSRVASLISHYHNAIRHYVETGDTFKLEAFRGQRIRTKTGSLAFVTDPAQLDRLAEGAELTYDVYLRY